MSDRWNAAILGAACLIGGFGTLVFKDARNGDFGSVLLDCFFIALGIALLWPMLRRLKP